MDSDKNTEFKNTNSTDVQNALEGRSPPSERNARGRGGTQFGGRGNPASGETWNNAGTEGEFRTVDEQM